MTLTRAFKSGNSQAVRIPAELAYDEVGVDLTIARVGDVIVIAPARATMKDVIGKLRAMPNLRAMPETPGDQALERIEMPDRAWD